MKQGISDWSQAFEAQKQASSSQQADLTQRITGLSQKIAEQTQKTTVLEKDKERLAVEKNALSEALTKTKSELEEIKKGKQIVSQGIEKATIDTLRKQVAALSKKVETKDAEITGLQKENRARIAERDELSCQVANWNTSYAKIEEAQKKIFEWIEKRDAGIAELKILMTEVVANKQAQSRPGGG
jgi:chromosome segregation ATPase